MEKEEVKNIVDNILGVNSVIDVMNAPEAAIYTDVWNIDFEKLDSIRSKGVTLLNISTEGGKLTLRVKL